MSFLHCHSRFRTEYIVTCVDPLSLKPVPSAAEDLYIRAIIQDALRPVGGLQSADRSFIIDRINSRPDRTLLRVRLILNSLAAVEELSRARACQIIDNTLPVLEAVHHEMLSKISSNTLATQLLQLVIASRRPLSEHEIDLALAASTSAGSNKPPDEHGSQHDIPGTMQKFLDPVVCISDSIVTLDPQIAKEFLRSYIHPGIGAPFSLQISELQMASACV